jgi:formyltetrahydrofolate deformylase
VDHALSAEGCAVVGRDAECPALARAVQWHVDGRVVWNAGCC